MTFDTRKQFSLSSPSWNSNISTSKSSERQNDALNKVIYLLEDHEGIVTLIQNLDGEVIQCLLSFSQNVSLPFFHDNNNNNNNLSHR